MITLSLHGVSRVTEEKSTVDLGDEKKVPLRSVTIHRDGKEPVLLLLFGKEE